MFSPWLFRWMIWVSFRWVFRIRCWAILPCWTCERIWIPWTFKWCCGSLSGRDQCHQPLVWLNKNTNRVRHMVKRSHFMAPTCVRLKSFWVSCVHPLEAIIGPFQSLHCTRISFTILIPASQPVWPAGRFWHLWPAGRFGVIWPAGRFGVIWPAGRLGEIWPAGRLAGRFGIPWPPGRNVRTKKEFFHITRKSFFIKEKFSFQKKHDFTKKSSAVDKRRVC